MLHDYLNDRLPEVSGLCLKYRVKRLYAFGSVVDGRFVEGKSDIDLLVELKRMPKDEKYKMLVQLWFDLQNVLSCKVDLITGDSIKGKYFKKYIEMYKELVFEA